MKREHGPWQRIGLLLVVALLTVSTFATVVHRHIGDDEQGCVLCHSRHDPGLDGPAANDVSAPVSTERPLFVAEIQVVSRDPIALCSGRAPPSFS